MYSEKPSFWVWTFVLQHRGMVFMAMDPLSCDHGWEHVLYKICAPVIGRFWFTAEFKWRYNHFPISSKQRGESGSCPQGPPYPSSSPAADQEIPCSLWEPASPVVSSLETTVSPTASTMIPSSCPQHRVPHPEKELEMEFNKTTGQTVLTRCRTRTGKHTNQWVAYMPLVLFIHSFLYSITIASP